MATRLDDALFACCTRVFEELTFALLSAELAPNSMGTPTVGARITFAGPFRGELVLRLPRAVLPELVAAMIGEDEPPSDEAQRDALGEIANVICGNLLPLIAGREALFRLDAPRVGDVAGEVVPATAVAAATIPLEGGPVEATLLVEAGAAERLAASSR